MKLPFCLILSMLVVFGCTGDDEYSIVEAVDPEIREYFDRFEYEAQARGKTISWIQENIYAQLTDIAEEAVGQCLTFEKGKNQINVDLSYWNASNDLKREFLIFHELGHCILERSHLDDANRDGTCVSLMNSGESLCQKNYNYNTRNKYIDELFF